MRRFTEILQEVRDGRTEAELTEELSRIVQHSQFTGKPSTLTYTIKVAPAGNGKVVLSDTISSKLPEADRETSIFYHNDAFELSRRQPGQYELEDLRQPEGTRR